MAATASAPMAQAASTRQQALRQHLCNARLAARPGTLEQGRGLRSTPHFIEGEAVTHGDENRAFTTGDPHLPPEIRLWPHHPRRRQQTHHRLRKGRRKARARQLCHGSLTKNLNKLAFACFQVHRLTAVPLKKVRAVSLDQRSTGAVNTGAMRARDWTLSLRATIWMA